MNAILGISSYYHDAAAALVVDGQIIAACQEERFTRKKHDSAFPVNSIRYCLKEANLELKDVKAVVFYEKPIVKFERILETQLATSPRSWKSFLTAMPVWLKEKLFLKQQIYKELTKLSGLKRKNLPQLLFTEHHQSHAGSAFFPSPFKSAAVICLDGVGEWTCSSVWKGSDNRLELQWEQNFPHSLGLLYSAFTYFTGFKVNSGEYKLMGLAPYGEPKYVDTILENLVDLKEDGTFRLNLDYFDFVTGFTMTGDKFASLFDGPARQRESPITAREMDLARSIQHVTEEIVLRLARTVQSELHEENVCLAGGVALNCVANGKLMREGPFKNIWIQPAAGDSGGALGAALCAWYEYFGNPRVIESGKDFMRGSYLGPALDNHEARRFFDSVAAPYTTLADDALMDHVSQLIADGKVIGWCSGRMEYGPRALGGRSILGDARSPVMQSTMNLKVKHRESFRPFAPAVLEEHVGEWFELRSESPYMLLVAPVHPTKRVENHSQLTGLEKRKDVRSQIPAVTHVDHSARVQTVSEKTNPRFHRLIETFYKKTDCPVIINTSFNVRGEPIVCSVEDAYRCFMRCDIDALVVENCLLVKSEQPGWSETGDWKNEFELD